MNSRILRTSAFGITALLAVLLGFAFAANSASAASSTTSNPQIQAQWWNNCVYYVHPGDTLFSIGIRYGVSPYYLAQINGLYNPNYIYAGMRLAVPCGQMPPRYPAPPNYPPPPPVPCKTTDQYLVRPGDSLFRIAYNYGTTVNALRDANQLWGRVLRPGMTLQIPCPGSVPYGNKPPVAVEEPTQVPTPTPPPAPNGVPQLLPEPSAKVIIGAGPDPTTVDIKKGQSVVWINNTGADMTLVSGIPGQPNGLFNSGPIPNGGTYLYAFDTAGNYSYFVNENPTLAGQINVSQ